jgi:hypothetical protein
MQSESGTQRRPELFDAPRAVWRTARPLLGLASEYSVNVNDHTSTRLINNSKSVHVATGSSLGRWRQPLLNLVWEWLHLLLPPRW